MATFTVQLSKFCCGDVAAVAHSPQGLPRCHHSWYPIGGRAFLGRDPGPRLTSLTRCCRLGDRSVKVSPFNLDGRGKPTPIVIDDIVSTDGTMIETVKQIRAQGGAPPVCIAVHPLFVGESYRELRPAGAGRIVSSNTIRHRSNTIDVTKLLATAIASQLNGTQDDSRNWTLPRLDEAEP